MTGVQTCALPIWRHVEVVGQKRYEFWLPVLLDVNVCNYSGDVVYAVFTEHHYLFTVFHQSLRVLMEYREQVVVFRKDGINHIARIITYVDIKKNGKPKLISLLTNDFDMPPETIVAIYRRRWQIESLFKQIKQNFPLRYFYGESANAIKIQIWVTLIANLLLSVLQSKLERRWSFSGLATIVRIVLMYYLNLEKFLNQPDADLKIMLAEASESPPEVPENC